MTIVAKALSAGAIRNVVWIDSVNNTVIGKEAIEAYVIVNSTTAPVAAFVTPVDPAICTGGSVVLTASVAGASSYQWFCNNAEISGATQQSYTASSGGSYTVTYFDSICVSQMSDTVRVSVSPLPDFVSVDDTTVCTAVTLNDLVSNLSVNSVVLFYRDAQGSILLPSPRVDILSDTLYYVRAVDTVTGCVSEIHTLEIHPGTYPAESPITGAHSVCVGDTISLSNAALEGGTWSVSNSSIAELVSPTTHNTGVKGLSEGEVYISYTIGLTACQTRVTFNVKVIQAIPPRIIIGVER
jgi:hypothetical protein